jgi:CubicO group peptidase (beta-lactamase class C family)
VDVFDAVRTRRKELGVPGVAVGLLRDGEERHEGFGRGDDALARYVDGMRTLPQLTPLGEVWSYNNAGFALAGRAIEVATGERFEDVVQRLVLEPLELAATTYRPWDAMTERFAVGHVGDEPGVAHPWPLARSTNPAGGVISTTPDLLRYARLHLDPPPALARMQLRQVDIGDEGEWMGLTWYGEDAFGTIRHGARWRCSRTTRPGASCWPMPRSKRSACCRGRRNRSPARPWTSTSACTRRRSVG